MQKKSFWKILIVLLVIGSLLVACAPKATEAPSAAEPAAEEPAAEEPAAEEPAAEEPAMDEIPCDFDEQTCEFLKGKDFTGQTLVVGVWGGVIEEIQRDTIIPPLEARGATVELLLGGTGDRLTKIYAERDNPTMHIAYLNIYESRQTNTDGVTEKPGPKIPAYNDMYPLAQIGCYGMSFMGLGIAYNKEAFPDGPPNWADLWDESHVGKIGVPQYPGSEGDGFLAMAARLNGSDETNPDAGFEKLAELKPITVWNSLDEVFLLLESGELHASPMISGYAWTYMDDGMDFGFSWPEEGTVAMMDALCIVANNPNSELADAYTQIALSPKTQEAYANRIYFGPTNSTVELTGEVADRCVYGAKADSLVGLDWAFVINERVPNTEKWNRQLLEE